ncbi:YfbU family protein [Rhodobacter ferrooxidans]|uniref:YfbU family protein n=1 Tax=Rhodobacter ferrooxidans TaxID=371731 RepID=C8RYD9_9RHOB|nr:YfbU family protein [Rhodobacter sp. SW2]EEW26127.1 conserved hypothetical protein [Rhodobacter sp. SW2]
MRKFNNFERLSILVAASASPDLKEKFVDVEMVAKWVSHGHEWALSYEYDYFDDEKHPLDSTVKETSAIFEMYRLLQQADPAIYKALGLAANHVSFEGFDGNNDEHYHVASVLVEDLGSWSDVHGATNNSHSAGSIGKYRKMLVRYEEVKSARTDSMRDPLTSEEVKSILGI